VNQQKKGSVLSNHFYSKGCCNSSFAMQRELLCIFFFAVLCSKLIAYCHELEFGFLYSRRALDMDGTLNLDSYNLITLMILSQTQSIFVKFVQKKHFVVTHWPIFCRLKIKFIILSLERSWCELFEMSWSNKSIQRMFLGSSLTIPKL
jgi:hypothetical protein